jgi:hypothetical protein
MRILRIAARVAAGLSGKTLVLDGPVGPMKGGYDHDAAITVPFGLGGAVAEALAAKWGLTTPEELRQLAEGPVEDLLVMYRVESDHYSKGSKDYFSKSFGNWLPGDPAEYELVLQIQGIDGLKLSDADARAFEAAGALDILTAAVEDRHLGDLQREEPGYDYRD